MAVVLCFDGCGLRERVAVPWSGLRQWRRGVLLRLHFALCFNISFPVLFWDVPGTVHRRKQCWYMEHCTDLKRWVFRPDFFWSKALFAVLSIILSFLFFFTSSCSFSIIAKFLNPEGGFNSKILRLQHKYSKSLSWEENLNKLLTVLGGKFKFSA